MTSHDDHFLLMYSPRLFPEGLRRPVSDLFLFDKAL